MGPQMVSALQDLFKQQHQYVNYFFQSVNLNQIQEALQACLNCSGSLIFTGVGKSGIIAEKIAMTLISTGTKALYLPSLNFLHGDIGIVSSDDLVIFLSKSGETEELLELIPFLRRKKCLLMSVVSNEESRLARLADHVVCLPIEKELCPFDLAPTTSTVVQLLFGDLLAMALMREKGISLQQYADNHPSGFIGKKTLCVKDLMRTGKEIPFCHFEDILIDVIVTLSDKKCGCLLIIDEQKKLLGIFTDGDLRRALHAQGTKAMERKMGELMILSPISVKQEDLVMDALKEMQNVRFISVAPVLHKEKVVGIIRMHDIVQAGI